MKDLAQGHTARKAELGVNSWQCDLRDYSIYSLAVARQMSEDHRKTDMNKVIFF